jgi:hypothetical protein
MLSNHIKWQIELMLQNSFVSFGFWVLIFASIVGLSLEIRQRYGFNPASSLLAVSLGIVNVLFWGTYINFHLVQMVIIGSGIFFLWTRRDWLIKDKITYLILTILILWFAGICINNVPFSWDEFFWTLFDQHIANYSSYWDIQSGILITHIRYMPGAALWHNFFGIKGIYTEANAYFSISVLYVLIFYWLISEVLKSNRWFYLAITVLTLGCFSEGWFVLYVDPLLGLMMAVALIAGFRYFQGQNNYYPVLILAIANIILLKETGMIPMLAIIFALAIGSVTHYRSQIQWRHLILGLIYCVSIIVAWKIYQSIIGASNPVQLELFTDNSSESTQFRMRILSQFFNFAAFNYIMLAIWGLFFLILIRFKMIKASAISYAYFVLMVFGFIAIHLIAWLYLVGDGLAGNNRYMGSLLIALFIFYGWLLSVGVELKRSSKFLLIAFLLWAPINLILVGTKPSALFMLVTPHPKQVPIAREKLIELKKMIPADLLAICHERPTKAWFIYQNSIGYEAMMARHIMTPCQVAPGSFSLGSPYFPGDIWTANYNDSQFIEMAKSHPYLVIARIDSNFINKYQHLFASSPETGVLYKFDELNNKFREFKP